MLLYACPHTSMSVSSCYYVCGLILLYMSSYYCICWVGLSRWSVRGIRYYCYILVSILYYTCQMDQLVLQYIGQHTTIYTTYAAYCHKCVLKLLYMFLHTTIWVLILLYACPRTNIYVSPCRHALWSVRGSFGSGWGSVSSSCSQCCSRSRSCGQRYAVVLLYWYKSRKTGGARAVVHTHTHTHTHTYMLYMYMYI
jgi:hypothetical protein